MTVTVALTLIWNPNQLLLAGLPHRWYLSANRWLNYLPVSNALTKTHPFAHHTMQHYFQLKSLVTTLAITHR